MLATFLVFPLAALFPPQASKAPIREGGPPYLPEGGNTFNNSCPR